jgi:polar amino acid transport system substrate-binding protein
MKPVQTSPDPPVMQQKSVKPEPFHMAVSGDFKPFHFHEGGEVKGFDVDLALELAKRLEREATITMEPRKTLLHGLQSGNYDAVVASLSITDERQERVDLSAPYYRTGGQFFRLQAQSELVDLAQLQEKTVGAVTGSIFYPLVQQYTSEVKLYPDEVAMIRALITGEIDALICDRMVGLIAVQQEGIPLEPLGDTVYVDEVGIAVKKGNSQLLKQINEALTAMKADGTYEEISKKWFGRNIWP